MKIKIIKKEIMKRMMKRIKQNYYSKYFESNLTKIINKWKGINIIIPTRNFSLITPTLLSFENEAI